MAIPSILGRRSIVELVSHATWVGGAFPGVLGRAVALMALMALTACTQQGLSLTAAASIPEVAVRVEDGRFVPGAAPQEGVPSIVVPVGTTVRWENRGNLRHTATHAADGFPLPDGLFDIALEPGEDGTYTFADAGRYEVICVPHPVMQLVIAVE